MTIEILANAEEVAQRAASFIADQIWEAVGRRGLFVMAVSGGHTPWLMLRQLVAATIPWQAVHIMQVDERVAPEGDPDRNLTHLREILAPHTPNVYAMPVESADLRGAAARYAESLREIAGAPPVLDLVHLGLGADGHTASLVPGDPLLDIDREEVAVSGLYRGRQRMTLTYPALNRARQVLWVVTGREKSKMVSRLLGGDRSIPAGRVRSDRALLLADLAAAPAMEGEALCA